MLRALKIEQIEIRFKLGAKAPSFVFCHVLKNDAGPLSPNNVTRAWHRACRRHGARPVRFHSLRHTQASLLIAEGEDILTVSRLLGHSKAATTLNVYAHLLEGADSGAAKKLERILK